MGDKSIDVDALITKLKELNDPSIPPWALLLIQSVCLVLSDAKDANSLANRVNELEDFKSVSTKVTKTLKQESDHLRERLELLERRVDNDEQRSRNQCLLIHGIPEDEDEDTNDVVVDVIKSKIGISDFSVGGVQNSHRLGPREKKRNTRSSVIKPRPIILRFVYYCDRQAVFRNKKRLKGKNISVSENLTKYRMSILNAAKTKYDKENVWTSGGNIIVKSGGEIKAISTMEEV